jgi:hypothetical protein
MKYGRRTVIVGWYLLIEIPDFLSNEQENDYMDHNWYLTTYLKV